MLSGSLASRGVVAAFTERTGGRSGGPFASLNLGVKDGDRPDAVAANRRTVCDRLDIDAFAVAEQVHAASVGEVGPDTRGAGFDAWDFEGCDALVTREREAALAVLTADCVPVALADGDLVAAVHVGWRGAAAGIVDGALGRFRDPAAVTAALGPAIRSCHYRVDDAVIAAVAAGLGVAPVVELRDGPYLDLAPTVAAALRARGVNDVADSGLCTACESDRFYSYRRDGRTGRQALVVFRR